MDGPSGVGITPGYNVEVRFSTAASDGSANETEKNFLPEADTGRFSWRQRVLLWVISRAAYSAIALIGPTLRYSLSWEEAPIPSDATHEKQVIYSFWHRGVFAGAWLWRKAGVAVMVSRSFDGEYIARTIEKLGFASVRGSSSRGGATAWLGLRGQLDQGRPVAFTIDGPRGPRFVAKAGPVLLARASGRPMAAFSVALSGAWALNTWDAMLIPKPFSRALVRFSAKMQVPPDAGEEQMAEFHRQLQAALERVTVFAEEHVTQVGSAQFPILKSSQNS